MGPDLNRDSRRFKKFRVFQKLEKSRGKNIFHLTEEAVEGLSGRYLFGSTTSNSSSSSFPTNRLRFRGGTKLKAKNKNNSCLSFLSCFLSLFLNVCLSVSLTLSLSVSLSVCVYTCVYTCVNACVYAWVYAFVYACV